MLLEPEQIHQIEEDLKRYLIDARLDWLVDEFETIARGGKLVAQQVRIAQEPTYDRVTSSLESLSKGSRRTSTLIGTSTYTDEERLMLLIELIEWVVVKSAMMEQEIIGWLAKDFHVKSVEFLSEDVNFGPPQSISLNDPEHRQAAEKLSSLLNELKGAVSQ